MKLDNQIIIHTAIKLLAKGRSINIRAEGFSMYPFLHPGDSLVVEPVEPIKCRRGDIVFFMVEQQPVAHRIISINNSHFTCRGDAVRTYDGTRPINQILGRVAAYSRNDKLCNINTPFRRLQGHFIILLHPLMVRIAAELRRVCYRAR